MLPDSGHIQEYEAERAIRPRGRHPARIGARGVCSPLYTVEEAKQTLNLLRPIPYGEITQAHPAVGFRFRNAGHILGSSIIEVWVDDSGRRTKLVFSGDLGQPGRPILQDPEGIDEADVLVVESTYGNRQHKDPAATLDDLVDAVNHTLHEKRGNVIIPAFAVGRTQEIIYHLHDLTRQGRLHDLNIFVDSPMASAATRATIEHLALFDQEAKRLAAWRQGGHGLPRLRFVETPAESHALNEIRSGAVIISASGMCEAGRIKHHLQHNLPRKESSVLIVGYQAQGTLGRRLVDGARRASIFGEEFPVRAQVYTLNGLSAHADRGALLDWLGKMQRAPSRTFVVHGEDSVATGFARDIRQRLGWDASVPEADQTVAL
jgi:metallo-beta-lactamase family protein